MTLLRRNLTGKSELGLLVVLEIRFSDFRSLENFAARSDRC